MCGSVFEGVCGCLGLWAHRLSVCGALIFPTTHATGGGVTARKCPCREVEQTAGFKRSGAYLVMVVVGVYMRIVCIMLL